jgi:hypothetical protein
MYKYIYIYTYIYIYIHTYKDNCDGIYVSSSIHIYTVNPVRTTVTAIIKQNTHIYTVKPVYTYTYRKTGKDNGDSHHQAEHNHILELDKGELDRAPLHDRCHKPRKNYHSHIEGRHRRIRAEQHEEPAHTSINRAATELQQS